MNAMYKILVWGSVVLFFTIHMALFMTGIVDEESMMSVYASIIIFGFALSPALIFGSMSTGSGKARALMFAIIWSGLAAVIHGGMIIALLITGEAEAYSNLLIALSLTGLSWNAIGLMLFSKFGAAHEMGGFASD